MSATQLKTELHKYLDAVKDETFLRAVHSMFNTYLQHSEAVVGYRSNNEPITQQQLLADLEASEESPQGLGDSYTHLSLAPDSILAYRVLCERLGYNGMRDSVVTCERLGCNIVTKR